MATGGGEKDDVDALRDEENENEFRVEKGHEDETSEEVIDSGIPASMFGSLSQNSDGDTSSIILHQNLSYTHQKKQVTHPVSDEISNLATSVHVGIHGTLIADFDVLKRQYQQIKTAAHVDTTQRADIETLKAKVAELEKKYKNDSELGTMKENIKQLTQEIDRLRTSINKSLQEFHANTVVDKPPLFVQNTSQAAMEVDSSHYVRCEADFSYESSDLGITTTTKVTVHLGKCLGEGGFGEVYEIKMAKGVFAAKLFDEKMIKRNPERLHREIDVLRKCTHRNIVKYYGSCQIPERSNSPALIMELMETNFEIYYTDHKPTVECKVKILKQVAEGLDYLHSKCDPKKSIVHRDLTARNVLLSSDGITAKIADFGFSKFVESVETVVSMSKILGTRYYLAPEVDTLKHRYNVKVDIFSFGHLALVSCLGRIIKELPDIRCGEEDRALTEIERRAEHFRDLRELPTSKHADLEKLIKLCLELNHQQRPTAAEVIKELSNILEHFSVLPCKRILKPKMKIE